MDALVRFSGVKHFERPFAHAQIEQFFDPDLANLLADWLREDAPWLRSQSGFYDQHELNLKDAAIATSANAVLQRTFLSAVRRNAESVFGVSLEPFIKVSAHKLIPGQGIGVHNDGDHTQETHRIVVQLSRGLTPASGGALVLFWSPDINDVAKVVLPVFNTAFAFRLGGPAFHAVAELAEGERYTVLFSFWEVRDSPDGLDPMRFQRYFPAHD
jgi:Rps23 Pro-64 3,4-dihydroxylase Tpa1-like proline 4-hydroxylase